LGARGGLGAELGTQLEPLVGKESPPTLQRDTRVTADSPRHHQGSRVGPAAAHRVPATP